MTFMQNSSSQFMSMYVTGQTAATSGMQTPVLAQGGRDTTYSVFGEGSAHRAGDFSGITVDPPTAQASGRPTSMRPARSLLGANLGHVTLRSSPSARRLRRLRRPSDR
jgi:hypothetical protein